MTEFNTKLVHQPAQHDNNTGAVTVPIYKATTFKYPEVCAQIKDDYSRSGNPTRRAVEEQLAALEEGDYGFCFSSGMAAIHAALAIFKKKVITCLLETRFMAGHFGYFMNSLSGGG